VIVVVVNVAGGCRGCGLAGFEPGLRVGEAVGEVVRGGVLAHAPLEGGQGPGGVEFASGARPVGEPGDGAVGAEGGVVGGALVEVVVVELVGLRGRGVVAGHHVGEVVAEGGPAPQHRGQAAQFEQVLVAGGRAGGGGGGVV